LTPAPAIEAPLEEQPEQQDYKQLYGENFENLPEQIVNVLREQVREFQGQERWLRRREVMRDRRNRFYERGFQHIYWNSQGASAGFTMITPGGSATNASGQMVQAPRYCDDYNLYRRYLQINMAILTQTSPGIDFRPNDASRSEDIESAEAAELYRHDFDRNNDVMNIRQATIRMMGVSGRTIRWTRTVEDAQKFGNNPDGSPKKVEISSVYGTLESKVPILAKCQADCLYVFLSDDPDIKQAKAEYPDFADKIKAGIAGLGENAYERLARLGVLQGSRSEMLSADSYTHLVTRMHCWMRPNSFTGERYDDPLDTDPGTTIGDFLKELFPEGCCVKFVGDTYVGSYPEAIEDSLCIEFPWEGDGMNREGFMEAFVVVQDSFNDAMNASREVFDVGWPSTWVSCETGEYDAIVQQRAEPYAIREKKVTNGQKTADLFFREPNPELPATFVEFMQDLQGPLPQFMLAAPPALFGAAMEDQKTASGYAQARAQAMGQQGLIFSKLQKMDAVMYYQAALCAAKDPQDTRTILIPGGSGQTAQISMEKISKGNFKVYPAGDSNMPESTAAKRATIEKVLTLLGPTPLFPQITAVPKNMRMFLDMEGLEEISIPEAEAYDREMFIIEQLLKLSPVPPDPQMQEQALIDHAAAAVKITQTQPGAPVPPPPQLPPTCPIPPQPWEFHNWAASADQEWLNSEACRREQANGNDAGVQNVVLRWQANSQLAAAAQMQAMAAAAATAPATGTPEKAKGPGSPAGTPGAGVGGGGLLPESVNPPGAPGMPTT
jgi:hypothetical protein